MQVVTNHTLYWVAEENYRLLTHYCELLEQENYWEQPQKILGYPIGEFLERYTCSLLIRLAAALGGTDEEMRHWILSIMKHNVFSFSEKQEIPEQVYEQAGKLLNSPPILLQLCGLRDVERNTGITGLFFDALVNLMLAEGSLGGKRNPEVSVFLKEYYESIQVFLYRGSEGEALLDETYLFYKLCHEDLFGNTDGLWKADENFDIYLEQTLKFKPRREPLKTVQETGKAEETIEKSLQEAKGTEETIQETEGEAGQQEEVILEASIQNQLDEQQNSGFANEQEEFSFREYMKQKLKAGVFKSRLLEEACMEQQVNGEQDEQVQQIAAEAYENGKEVLPDLTDETLKEESIERISKKHLMELLECLNCLVGLQEVKQEIHSLVNLIQVRKMREEYHLPEMEMSYHMIFTGNPGTGKTTVARLVAEIYRELGLLSKGILVETDRSGLVAGYIGQTALKVRETVESAMGGVLFIDEAYSLSNSLGADDFGSEAIDTLVKLMEDKRDDLVIIAAGYTTEMERFLKANTGLVSRFNKFIKFQDYTVQELMEILIAMAGQAGFYLEDEALLIIKNYLDTRSPEETAGFGNARGIRNIFEKLVVNQANRVVSYDAPTVDQLSLITKEDAAPWIRAGRQQKKAAGKRGAGRSKTAAKRTEQRAEICKLQEA